MPAAEYTQFYTVQFCSSDENRIPKRIRGTPRLYRLYSGFPYGHLGGMNRILIVYYHPRRTVDGTPQLGLTDVGVRPNWHPRSNPKEGEFALGPLSPDGLASLKPRMVAHSMCPKLWHGRRHAVTWDAKLTSLPIWLQRSPSHALGHTHSSLP